PGAGADRGHEAFQRTRDASVSPRPLSALSLDSTKMSEARPAEYRNFSASLRIFGEIPDLDAISSHLGVPPTYTHRRGERRSKKAAPFEHDAWIFEAPVAPDRPLDEHLLELWRLLKPHAAYLRGLKRTFAVDVFCGYRSSS